MNNWAGLETFSTSHTYCQRFGQMTRSLHTCYSWVDSVVAAQWPELDLDYLQHFVFLNPMQCLIHVIRKDKTLLADNPEAFQYLKFHHANPTCLHRQIPVCSDAKLSTQTTELLLFSKRRSHFPSFFSSLFGLSLQGWRLPAAGGLWRGGSWPSPGSPTPRGRCCTGWRTLSP